MCTIYNKRDSFPQGAVYVGRPTKWGNPFKIGTDDNGVYWDRESVINLYREWIKQQPDLITAAKKELKGKDLVCWCTPLPCHAEVLMEIANTPEGK